jgi:hypothetical protein
MHTERDVTDVVRSWLRRDEHVSADRVLDSVLARLDATPQHRSWWPPPRFAEMNTFAGLAIATILVVVVAAIGINLMPAIRGIVGGGPTASPSPSATPQPSSSPSPVAAYPPASDLSGLGVAIGRHSVSVDGIPLSFEMPARGWEPREVYLSKSAEGPQPAEAIIFWAAFPGGWIDSSTHTGAYVPCIDVLGSPVGRSVGDLAAAVSSVSGTDVVSGPTDVSVGGHAAKHVELFLTYSAEACGQGFFYGWDEDKDPRRAAWWTGMIPGDTVRVWIVDVDGALLFIEAATHWNAGTALGLEIQQIVDSIVFE